MANTPLNEKSVNMKFFIDIKLFFNTELFILYAFDTLCKKFLSSDTDKIYRKKSSKSHHVPGTLMATPVIFVQNWL